MSENLEEVQNNPAFGLLGEQNIEVNTDELTISSYNIGKSFYSLAKIQYDKADFIQAEQNFKEALSRAQKPRDIYSLFKIYGFLIRISSEQLDMNKATQYIEACEQLLEESQVYLGSLNSEYFYNAGVVKTYKGEFETARENLLISLKKSKEENEPEIQAKTLLSLATNALSLGNHDNALDYLHQLNQLLRIINKSYLSGSMYFYTAKTYSEMGENNKALNYLVKANQFLQEKKCWNLQGYILGLKGTIYKRLGDFERAMIYFKLASETTDPNAFKRLSSLVQQEIEDVNDSNVDIYLDKSNRKVIEKDIGAIDFKHRFVLLEILFLLAQNPGVYYDKEELAQSIWKDEYNPLIHDKLIYTSVSRLRKLIEPKEKNGSKRKYIIRGKDGYTFNPQVKIRFHADEKLGQNGHQIANIDLNAPV